MTETLSLPIDRNSPVPLYHQLALLLEGVIHSGDLAPGTKLDNELELASRLRIARVTVRSALQHLVEAGLLAQWVGASLSVVTGGIACIAATARSSFEGHRR